MDDQEQVANSPDAIEEGTAEQDVKAGTFESPTRSSGELRSTSIKGQTSGPSQPHTPETSTAAVDLRNEFGMEAAFNGTPQSVEEEEDNSRGFSRRTSASSTTDWPSKGELAAQAWDKLDVESTGFLPEESFTELLNLLEFSLPTVMRRATGRTITTTTTTTTTTFTSGYLILKPSSFFHSSTYNRERGR